MPRASGRYRSYFTYKQIVVRAIVELEGESGTSRHGRAFHSKTLHNKIQDFAQAEEVHLGDRWYLHVTRATAVLTEEGVLRKGKQRGYVALAPKGRKRLEESHERYGSLDTLSPFKKSQFLKAVAVTSATPSSAEKTELSWKCTSQEKLVKSLRASLRKAESTSKSRSTELEEARRERDDLELTLRDLELSETSPYTSEYQTNGKAAGNPGLTLRFEPPMTSTPHQSRPEPTIPSERDSSPVPSFTRPSSPIPTPVPRRPVANFTHQPSGSFLNTLSRQFTPSPSPGRVLPGPVASGSLNPANDDDSDDGFDFDTTDLGYADMGGFEGNTAVNSGMDVDSEAIKQKDVELRDALDKALDLEARLAVAEKDAAMLADTVQQLAATAHDRDAVTTQLASMTQERDTLQHEKLDLEAALRDREHQIGNLQNTLATTVQARDVLQSAMTSTHEQAVSLDNARIAAESEKARVSAELEHRVAEVTALTARVGSLTMELRQSNAQRDDANARLQSTTSQLETTTTELQTTNAQLAATDVQLRGVQGDMRMFWKDLQTSNTEHRATQAQLQSAESQFQSTRAELDMANARLDSTVSQLDATSTQLQTSNAQFDATNVQLAGTRNELQALWIELQSSNARHGVAERQLQSTNAQLDATNVELIGTRDDLQRAWQDLQTSNVELNATNTQLRDARAELQTIWGQLKQTHDREEELKDKLADTNAQLDISHTELEQAIRNAADRERMLKTQLEDAHERVTLAQEDLDRFKTAWCKAEEKKRIAAEEMKRAVAEAETADQEVHNMLFGSSVTKRDASFRDSGVSFTM